MTGISRPRPSWLRRWQMERTWPRLNWKSWSPAPPAYPVPEIYDLPSSSQSQQPGNVLHEAIAATSGKLARNLTSVARYEGSVIGDILGMIGILFSLPRRTALSTMPTVSNWKHNRALAS